MADVALTPLLVCEVDARRLLGGLSAKTLYLLRRDSGLPFVKVGSRTLYDPRDVARWVEERKSNGSPTA